MKYAECFIAWTPNRKPWADYPTVGKVEVGPFVGEDEGDWSAIYAHTGGAVYSDRRKASSELQRFYVFNDFNQLVVRDGLDPAVVHAAFLVIDEYAEGLSEDTPGAR
ncbi:hypothetical protein [Asticcacaulis sp.]|uniref:hypothetical protein n=1 Tax=Asticcacaulis sp. TaxID=1872648 RepID=UPI0031D6CCE2